MDYYDHIDDYMAGTLSAELRQQFEAAMSTDASLRSAVDNYEEAKSIAEGMLEIDMMETLGKLKAEKNQKISTTEFATESKDSKSTASIFTIRRLMAAASLIGLIAVAAWWMNDNSAMKNEMWKSQYAGIIDPDATKSVDGVEGKDPLQVVKHYYGRNYNEECIEAVERLLTLTTNADTVSKAYLYLGDTYMKRSYHYGHDNWKEAIDALNKSNEPSATKRKLLAIEISK